MHISNTVTQIVDIITINCITTVSEQVLNVQCWGTIRMYIYYRNLAIFKYRTLFKWLRVSLLNAGFKIL